MLGDVDPFESRTWGVAFEEGKAPTAARKRRLSSGTIEPSRRTRQLVGWLAAIIAVAVMAYAVWDLFGPIVGLVALAALVAGAAGLWRLWR